MPFNSANLSAFLRASAISALNHCLSVKLEEVFNGPRLCPSGTSRSAFSFTKTCFRKNIQTVLEDASGAESGVAVRIMRCGWSRRDTAAVRYRGLLTSMRANDSPFTRLEILPHRRRVAPVAQRRFGFCFTCVTVVPNPVPGE
jgi:hypothetical protein